MKSFDDMIKALPPELQQEAYDFIEFLYNKGKPQRREGAVKLAWRGALRDMKGEYTSVELQRKVLEWWGD